MYHLTKIKGNTNENLKSGSIEECIYYLCSLEDNIYHSLAHKGYNIFDDEQKIIYVSHEVKEKVEKQYRKDLYFKRVNRINEIIKMLDLTADIEYQQKEENNYFYPDNIRIIAKDKNKNEISFSMGYNNKGKVDLSPIIKRDKEEKLLYVNSFSISFSLEKDLQKIKKDIEKRFYPKWQEVLKEEKEKLQNNNQYIDTTLKNLEELKGEKLTEEEKRSKTIYHLNDNISNIRVSENSVYLDLYSLPIEKAKKVIEALN